jgi:hypothetical protein
MSNYASVKTQHRDYIRNAEKWRKIRHVLDGDCKQYLRNVGTGEPEPSAKAARQKEYEDGAVFYNFTKRTLSGMIGMVTRKDPEIILPAGVEYLMDNADGAGIGLVQQSQDALREVSALGRAGLLVDAPNSSVATMAEQNAGQLNPRILLYTAENIINWRKTQFGSVQVVTLVVLCEPYEYANSANEFEWLTGEQYRVLEIIDGAYRQRIFRFDNQGADVSQEVIEPRIKGAPLTYIPFSFIGADNNDDSVDAPPMQTLADVNLGHYQNSADVEDSAFYLQGTLFLSPSQQMTATMFKEMYPDGVRMGSRYGYNLGEGGSAQIVQPDPNQLSRELMGEKEQQAIQIGAQLITPTSQITAESARLQRGADSSILANITMNVSSAYQKCIEWCCEFMGVTGEVVFELSQDFFLTPMTAQDRAQWLVDVNAGLLPVTAMYEAYRKAGVTSFTDEEIQEGLDSQSPRPAPALDVTGEIPEAPAEQPLPE